MKLLEGKKIAEKILKEVAKNIKKEKLRPSLAVILVGKNEASEIYVRLKGKAAKKIGINFQVIRFSEKVENNSIMNKIASFSQDKKISGIIVQLPLPKKFNSQKIISSIDPVKDVDGFHPKNTRLLIKGKEIFWPVFPHAIWRMIEHSGEKIKGKQAVIVANSKKFGEIMSAVLKKNKVASSYILCKDYKKFQKKIKNADILISACGHPGMIRGEIVKKGAMIIDGGITKKGDKVLGDADFASVKNVAGHLSPVPGGVGPVTIAYLLENVYLASKKQSK
jgi:methylenetetrahydrofolate dehydrogenase (NADP+)/methenyltetrahydrofolate cyclohydrolase